VVEERTAARRSRPLGAGGHLVVATAGLAVLLACAVVVEDGTVPAAEEDVFRAVNDLPRWLYPLVWPFLQLGNLAVAVAAGVLVALLFRRWPVLGAVVLAAVLKLVLEQVVKAGVERERPGTSIGEDVHLRGDVSAGGLSFVSGHAAIATAVAGLVAPLLPGRWKVVPWVLVAIVAFGRVYVGARNPLDVVGGVGLGLVIAGVLNAALRFTRLEPV
jgi:membrane-associated phospholipid phosphatase